MHIYGKLKEVLDYYKCQHCNGNGKITIFTVEGMSNEIDICYSCKGNGYHIGIRTLRETLMDYWNML